MNSEESQETMDALLDALFASAVKDGRSLTAAEVMRVFGLKRTSINVTYPHVNERRKAHNLSLKAGAVQESREHASMEDLVNDLRQKISDLRAQLQGERERSEQYAQVIRQLSLDNHELRLMHPLLTDARDRFSRAGTVDEG